jgi:DNA sulfur modification protein DndB
MFADLNRYAIRPSRSLGVLYDHRDESASIAKLIVLESPIFEGVVETERSNLSSRSRRLFTLSAIYTATKALLEGRNSSQPERSELARSFWEAAAQQFPEWAAVREGRLTAGEVRSDFIHSHGLVLHALGLAGNRLLDTIDPKRANLARRLSPLIKIDWTRANTGLWEGRAMVGGHLAKSRQNVVLTTNVLLDALKLPLEGEHAEAERIFRQGRR